MGVMPIMVGHQLCSPSMSVRYDYMVGDRKFLTSPLDVKRHPRTATESGAGAGIPDVARRTAARSTGSRIRLQIPVDVPA